MSVIEFDELTKHFGETIAVQNLDFEIGAGEIFGYLGPNGAGKTTTLRLLLGFLSPTAGTATVLGRDVRDESELNEAKQHIGYLPGELNFDGGVSGETFLDYQAALKGDARRSELEDLFTPPLERKIREYSSGNRQMLGLIQAFMHDPDLVIMDEPTSGLDPLKQNRLNEFLLSERNSGTTIVFSSHILGEVRQVADRIGIIRRGEIVALEDIDSLLRKGGKRVRITTRDPIDPVALDLEGIVDVEVTGTSARFTYAGEYGHLLRHLADYTLLDIDIEEPPIEDVFMHFYGDSNE